jgi:hypothetical protein
VKTAIEKRVVKTGFDLQNMKVDILSVSFRDKNAEATVAFIPRGGPPSGGATFAYELERQKDEWVVTGLKQGSMAGHAGAPGAPAPTPQGMPGDLPGGGMPGSLQGGAPAATGTTLPPGHPPIAK